MESLATKLGVLMPKNERHKMSECNSLLGWLFGHKFRPRYDVKESLKSLRDLIGDGGAKISGNAFPMDWERLAEKLKMEEKTYKCDVCERCGEIRR